MSARDPQQLVDNARACSTTMPPARLQAQLAGDPELRLAVLELLPTRLSERDAPLLRWMLQLYTQEYRAGASSGAK